MDNKYKRNGVIYTLLIILTVVVYLVIHLYYGGLKNEINQCNVEPSNNIYTVRTGDSLEAIAKMFNVSVEKLREMNNLGPNDELIPGQELIIPVDENDNMPKQPVNNIITTKPEEPPVEITKIKFSSDEIVMTIGSRRKLSVTIEPANASKSGLVWVSSDPSIATVDSSGNIVALKEGEVKITVKTKDGSISASCTIKVEPVKVDKIILNPTTMSVKVNSTSDIVAVIKPDNATIDELIWETSDPNIAKVDNNGRVTGVSEGTVVITARTPDGTVTATCVVNVVSNTVPASSIKVNPTSTSVEIGSSSQLLVTIEPSNATERDVIFESSNPSVVTVDSNGKITGVNVGTATITIKTKDGRLETTCVVTVTPIEVNEIILSANDLTVKVGKTKTITATVSPDDATDKELVWVSSDPSIATVDSNGKVTGVKAGEVTIIVKTKDGKVKAECKVTVEDEIIDDKIEFVYDYDEGNYIYLINQFPIKDEIGKNLQGDKRTQDFQLKFNANAVGVKYTITAEKLDGSDLDDNWAKLYLVNDGVDVENCYRANNRIKSFNEYRNYNDNPNEKILYEGTITSSEAARGYKDFTFRMWVSEDLKLRNSNYLSETKTFKTRINVYAVGE